MKHYYKYRWFMKILSYNVFQYISPDVSVQSIRVPIVLTRAVTLA